MTIGRVSFRRQVTIGGYCTVGVDRESNLTESALLKAMDQAGVVKVPNKLQEQALGLNPMRLLDYS